MSRQQDILNKGEKTIAVDGKAMKKTLTATHFVLGNDPPTWSTTATMADPTGEIDKYRAVITGRTASKGSSCYFGSDELDYKTTMGDDMGVISMDTAGTLDIGDMRVQAKKLKAELSGHNFVIGNDEMSYRLTSHDAFTYDDESGLAAQRTLSKEVMDDLRRQHFNFGNEKVHYETDMQRSMKHGMITPARLAEMKADSIAAQELKVKLLKTSVVIGDDPEYMH